MVLDPDQMDACELYVASVRPIGELEKTIITTCSSTGGVAPRLVSGRIEGEDYLIYVRRNPDQKCGDYRRTMDGFLFAPYIIEMYIANEMDIGAKAEFVKRVSFALCASPAEVTVACDFEELLPSSITIQTANDR